MTPLRWLTASVNCWLTLRAAYGTPVDVGNVILKSEPEMQVEFLDASDRLLAWCRDAALPFWASKGVDAKGRFIECASAQGLAEIDVRRRVRVQFRQVYAFDHAHVLGLGSGLKKVADRGMQRALADSFFHDDTSREHGCALLLEPDGRVADETRDLYTQSFYLLALAWRYRVTGDAAWLEAADRHIGFLEREMASPHGGYIESLSAHLPRRQNPHMHLFEAFLALHQISGQTKYLNLAQRMFDLFEAHFFDAKTFCVTEYFTQDWRPDPQLKELIEPGHMMEWAWLIHNFGKRCGRDYGTYVRGLYDKAREIGTDAASGLLIDEVRSDGTFGCGARRSWPQTEYLKAALVLAEEGHETALGQAAFIINALLDTYLNTPVPGIWRDAYDADGAATPAPAQASTFYHYMAAIGEVVRVSEALRAQPGAFPAPRSRDNAGRLRAGS
jgi:mannose/cellobiose epimerase-like protein (N-acyl-D-glucosamine 2-epimerase family)